VAVVIRMQRAGARNRPFWHIVVADERKRRDGRFLEKLGYYDPLPDPPIIHIDLEKVESWIGKGAQPSEKVRSLIKRLRREQQGTQATQEESAPTSAPEEKSVEVSGGEEPAASDQESEG
jgi:small subunit ribosomal protein S16